MVDLLQTTASTETTNPPTLGTVAQVPGQVTPMGTLASSLQTLIDTGQGSAQPILDKAVSSIDDQDANINQGVLAAKDINNSVLRNTLKGTAQNVLSNLAQRRMLNGDVASDTLGTAFGEVIKDQAAANSLAELEGVKLKAAIPSLYNTAANTQVQAGVANLAPYELLLNLLETDMYKYA